VFVQLVMEETFLEVKWYTLERQLVWFQLNQLVSQELS
jgi:hypothetical protein